jgi:plasmid stabilization system protein ParE
MTIRWTPTALADLECPHAYISEDNPNAAADTVDRVLLGIDALQRYPNMGRKGRVTGTRELVVSPFVVAYRSKKGGIEVLGIIHGARRWPDAF